MKKSLLLLLMLSFYGATAGTNLIRNTGFAADEYGDFGIWSISQKQVGITRLPGQGIDGKDAARLDFSKTGRLMHTGLQLVGGAKYKFGGYVRTQNFSGSEYYGFMLHDPNWSRKKLFRTGRFFRNTHGQWMLIEQTVTIPESGIYVFNIYAPNPKGTLEVCNPFVIPIDEKGKDASKLVPPPVPKKKMTGDNIIKNTSFKPDMYGDFGTWSISQKKAGITRLPGQGIDGKDAVRLDLTASGSLVHGGIKVVKGSKYRFGAFVRTENFSGKEYFGIMFHDSGWTKLFKTAKFPSDTKGKWVKIESTATANRDGLFQLNFYAPGPKGTLDICEPFVIPLDEDAVKAAGISNPALETWQRIYPITADLASLDPEHTEFTVAAHILLPDAPENYTVTAELAGQKKSAVLNTTQRVKISFKNLPVGKTSLNLKLVRKKDAKTVLANDYLCEVKPPIAPVPEKPLNNLVSEICRFEKITNGKYEFTVSDEAWYFIGLGKNEGNFSVRLNGIAEPVIIPRKNEPADTMRFLKPGKYQLTVSGITSAGNTLVVRKVKQLLLFPLNVSTPAPGEKFRFSYDIDFYRRYFWHTFNTQMLQHQLQTPTGCEDHLRNELHARGLKIIASGDVGPKENWTKADVIEKNLRTANGIAYVDGRALDEIGSRYAFEIQLATGDAYWNMIDFNKNLYLWMAQIRGYLHYPIVNSHLLAAIANASGGKGRMLMETYMLSTHDQQTYDQYLTAFKDHLEWADHCVPGGRRRIGFMLSGYTTAGTFNTWIHPQTDYKCIIDGFFRKLATDPELKGFDALGMYSIFRSDEELIRWLAKVVRHYAVEGKTENLSEKYGFKFNPGHIVNGDFNEKDANWTLQPAGKDSIVHRYEKRFGVKIQNRQRDYGSDGDHAMLFTRCAQAPNKISCKVTGLVPGRKYALRFITADSDDVKKPRGKGNLRIVSADITWQTVSHRSKCHTNFGMTSLPADRSLEYLQMYVYII